MKDFIDLNDLFVLMNALILFSESSLLIVGGFCQALDTFNTAVVSPVYYAMFTSLTIFASAIMFKVFMIARPYYTIELR